MTKASLHSVTKILFCNLMLLGVGILCVELVFGRWVYDDTLSLLNIRHGTWHYKFIAQEIKRQDQDVVYHRDQWGFRGRYGQPADIDILTVGGSTTDQRYVTEGATWQDVLQAGFRQVDKDVRVVNAGTDGRTTFGHLKDFEFWFTRIRGLAPRYVLFFVGVNDMFFDQPNGDFDRIVRESVSTFEGKLEEYKQLVRDNSATYYIFRTVTGLCRATQHDLTYTSLDFRNNIWTDKPVRNNYHQVLIPRLAGFRQRLQRLVDEVESWDAIPIFVTQSRGDFHYQGGKVLGLVHTQSRITKVYKDKILGTLTEDTGNGVDYYLILRLFNNVSMEVCKQRNGICLDLMSDLHFSIGDFSDHVHTTVSGSRKIGEFLFEKLNGRVLATN